MRARDEIGAILSALLSGARYGVKIRLPHALVMTFIFRRKLSFLKKLKISLNATKDHSCNLAMFAFTYKFVLLFLKLRKRKSLNGGLVPAGIPNCPGDALIAGGIGGYLVWGRYTAVNYQICLYLLSRIFVGGLLHIRESNMLPLRLKQIFKSRQTKKYSYQIFASCVWALVMYLFESEAPLHASLVKSMEEIYNSYESPDQMLPFD